MDPDSSLDTSPSKHPSVLRRMSRRIKQLFRGNNGHSLKESLEEAIEEHEELADTPINQDERAMLENVLSFGELTVEDVMIPRVDIEWVEQTISFDELTASLLEKGHTRTPVCRDVLDDVVGFIHVKDVMRHMARDDEFVIEKLLRHTLFVPPSMKTSALLLKMQMSRVHIAMVVDEYGGTCGMVTLEDVVEEIVGEIEDEHDVENGQHFMQIGKNRFEASARLPIDELEDKIKFPIKDPEKEEDYDTLGGLLFAEFGHVPVIGEVITIARDDVAIECEILDADPRRIKRVLVRLKRTKAPTEDNE